VKVPSVAVIVQERDVPVVFTKVANPPLVMVTQVVSLDVHATELVTFDPSLPCAVNCCCNPVEIGLQLVGLMVMPVILLTRTLAVAETWLEDAVMVVVPKATPVTTPAFTVATVGLEEVQVTVEVTSCVWLFPRVPVAVKSTVLFGCTTPLVGESERATTAVWDGKKFEPPQLLILTMSSRQVRVAKTGLIRDLIRGTGSSLENGR
jgi:hypothetical protein